MTDPSKTVFISYRRSVSKYLALLIFKDLQDHGYDVFLDVDTLGPGDFERIILASIAARMHFVLLLENKTVEGFGEPGDWLRKEIEYAMDNRRNIIPLLMDDFDYKLARPYLTGQLARLADTYNGLRVYYEYLDNGIERLMNDFLKPPDYNIPIVPVPTEDAYAVNRRIERATVADIELPPRPVQPPPAQPYGQQPPYPPPIYQPVTPQYQPPVYPSVTPPKVIKPDTPRPFPYALVGVSLILLVAIIAGVIFLTNGNGDDNNPSDNQANLLALNTDTPRETAIPTESPTVPTATPETPTLTPTVPSPTPTKHEALVVAERGVSSNAEWAPYMGIQGVTERDFDGVTMVLVPKGCFMMGSTTGSSDEAPVEEQCVDEPFWIDKTEVTNGQYGSSGRWSGDDYPRESVNWFDSLAHCQNRGGSLPTEKQWEYAARGPDALEYPWGLWDNTRLNFCDENCGEKYSYDGADTSIDDGYADVAPVGSYPHGASWVGALDMAGNVYEWTSSLYDAYPYTESREDNSNRTDLRALRGGSWLNYYYLVRAADRNGDVPTNEFNLIGFRCVRSY